LIAVLQNLAPGPWVVGGLVVIGPYFLAVGLADQLGSDHGTPV
jgi:hypothetical protein